MTRSASPDFSRRALLQRSFVSGAIWVSGIDKLRLPGLLLRQSSDIRPDGSLLAVVPFSGEGRPPMEEAIGSELDGRLFTDLTALTPENPLTPTDHFFIRTRASRLLDPKAPWTVQVAGRDRAKKKPVTISAESLAHKARPMGTHLIECAGNTKTAHFGMLSVAEWEGVPLEEILQTAGLNPAGFRVLISGFDRYQEDSITSLPGASWIFSVDQLFSAHAFLATKMNGQPLRADHGAPVRLVVPGWYGCACIKWVDQIALVSPDAQATSQMQEYAERTMQTGVPSLARDFRPATIDTAATPTRIEKWAVAGQIRYIVSGILWGQFVTVTALEIRFSPSEDFVPVQNVRESTASALTFWSHPWQPQRKGRFTIRLRVKAAVNARGRLNSGYYDRSVDIDEI